jgi:hypothetical protein
MRIRSLVKGMMLSIGRGIPEVVLKARIPRIYTALKESPRILPQKIKAVIIRVIRAKKL